MGQGIMETKYNKQIEELINECLQNEINKFKVIGIKDNTLILTTKNKLIFIAHELTICNKLNKMFGFYLTQMETSEQLP